jgi:hypothetical protein
MNPKQERPIALSRVWLIGELVDVHKQDEPDVYIMSSVMGRMFAAIRPIPKERSFAWIVETQGSRVDEHQPPFQDQCGSPHVRLCGSPLDLKQVCCPRGDMITA